MIFAGIVVLTAMAVFMDIPKSPSWAGSYFNALKLNLGLDLQGGSQLTYEADMKEIAEGQRAEAILGTRDVIERRVNAFGVSEPVVQTSTSGGNYRVIVELPGVTDVGQAIDRIGKTPLLEFRVPPENAAPDENVEETNRKAKESAENTLRELQAGADFEILAKERSEDPGSAVKGGDLDFVNRGVMVKPFEDVIFDKAEVGVVYPEVVETEFGYHVIRVDERRTVKNDEGVDELEVRSRHILFSKGQEEDPFAIFTYEKTELSGANLERASVQFDQLNNPTVSLEFDSDGAKLFEEMTGKYIGKQIAIFLDGAPISAPVVNQQITGGEAVITGSFTVEEAKELARNLNAGALPVPINLISQQNVGPSLGQVSMERSVFAGVVGFVVLATFMIAFYRYSGVLAMVALTIYLALNLAVYKIFGITLTLAGIAGFILSVGMAVDANVLIFERMREQRRIGKSMYQSIEDGFVGAWRSIRDSNVSSLITCLVLAWFGTSLIQGFAITLAIGILISMFTAITVTRTLLRLFVPQSLSDRWL